MCPVDCMHDMKVYRMKPTQEVHLATFAPAAQALVQAFGLPERPSQPRLPGEPESSSPNSYVIPVPLPWRLWDAPGPSLCSQHMPSFNLSLASTQDVVVRAGAGMLLLLGGLRGLSEMICKWNWHQAWHMARPGWHELLVSALASCSGEGLQTQGTGHT